MVIKNTIGRKVLKWIANLLTPCSLDLKLWDKKNYFLRLAGLNIARDGVAIDNNFFAQTGLEDNIFIDSYCAIGSKAIFLSFGKIKIGKFCMFAAGVTLANGGHDVSSFEPYSGNLEIGNGCWLGVGATIVGPLSIGDNCIVGAGSLVNCDIPAGSIVAGVPARIIGQRDLSARIWHFGGIYFDPITFTKVK